MSTTVDTSDKRGMSTQREQHSIADHKHALPGDQEVLAGEVTEDTIELADKFGYAQELPRVSRPAFMQHHIDGRRKLSSCYG